MRNEIDKTFFQSVERSLSRELGLEVKLWSRQYEKFQVSITGWDKFFFPDISIPDFISSIWNGFTKYSQGFVKSISKRTTNIMYVMNPTKNKVIGMLYVFWDSKQKDYIYWLGNLPATDLDFEEFKIQSGFELPKSLKSLLKIHNGFYFDGWLECGIRSTKSIYNLYEYGLVGSGTPLDENMYWGICGDGAGNERCIKQDDLHGLDDFRTFDWDHELKKFGDPKGFYEFINGLIT